MYRLLICTFMTAIVLVGCGVYSFSERGGATFKSLSIEPFENKTTEFGFTDRLTEIVVDAFIRDGTFRVVSSTSADASLIGTLTGYQVVPYKFDQSNEVQEYKVIMQFSVTLRNPKDDSEFWTEQFTEEGTYRASDQTVEDGQRAAGAHLVQAVLNKTTKSW